MVGDGFEGPCESCGGAKSLNLRLRATKMGCERALPFRWLFHQVAFVPASALIARCENQARHASHCQQANGLRTPWVAGFGVRSKHVAVRLLVGQSPYLV